MQIRNIKLFEPDIEAIPQFNWHKAQRYILLDAGIGSNVTDILKRINNIATHITNDRKEDAIQEVQNMTLGVFSAVEGIDYTSMIFACFVEAINGVKYPINTDEQVREITNLLKASDLTQLEVEGYITDLKKKLIQQ